MFTYRCSIVRVVDGDTIDVELDLGFGIRMIERVRLLGIDTPELYGPNASKDGQSAANFARDWIITNQTREGFFQYQSVRYNARDKYGRSLGYLRFIPKKGKMQDLAEDLKTAGHTK